MKGLPAEWRAKLAASGFQDLEGIDRDGPLSDRGNLHAKYDTEEADEALMQRYESGEAYTDWARGVAAGRRFRSGQERAIWALHADGKGLREIATELDTTYHQAREAVNAVKARVKRQSSKGASNRWPKRRYRRLGHKATVQLAAVLLKTLMKS